MQLLFIKARAQSYESGDTEMEFKLIGLIFIFHLLLSFYFNKERNFLLRVCNCYVYIPITNPHNISAMRNY